MGRYEKYMLNFANEEEEKLVNLDRRVHDITKHKHGHRTPFLRDYARILYSSSFRRLQGKMQLLGVSSTQFVRNRLTHSLEVAQIARSIAADLHLKNPEVSESCSLAHDLGNPPFGHHGERILNSLCITNGGFEGNAQTFRILTKLERKHYKYEGLNLTIRSLLGITKYFNKRDPKGDKTKQKFLYDTDFKLLTEELKKSNISDIKKSIDAQIMDIADEIAYAAHDFEDSLSLGIITPDELVYEFSINDKYKEATEPLKDIIRSARFVAQKANISDTSEEFKIVLKKEITSILVFTLCDNLGVIKDGDTEIIGYKSLAILAEGMKKLLFKAILRKRDIQLYELMGEKVIRGLWQVYNDPSFNVDNKLFPPELRNLEKRHSESHERLVIDYISGMMDTFAIEEYKKYFGKSSLDRIYPIITADK